MNNIFKRKVTNQANTKKWKDIHKWEKNKQPRKETVANLRLGTRHECLAAYLEKVGVYQSRECTIYQMPGSVMDEIICLIVLNLIKIQ